MQILAIEKLHENEMNNFVYERKIEDKSIQEATTEIEINVSTFDMTEQYLTEIIQTDGNIVFSDALYSIVFLVKKKTGHGSEPCVRRYIKTLTCSADPFEIIKNKENKKIIVKRSEN